MSKPDYHSIFNAMMALSLSGGRLKVVLCVFYYAYVCKGKMETKGSCSLKIDQIMRHTNLSRQSVISAIKWLEENELIVKATSEEDARTYDYSFGPEVLHFKNVNVSRPKGRKKKEKASGSCDWGDAKMKEMKPSERYKFIDVEEWSHEDFVYYLRALIESQAEKENIDLKKVVINFARGVARNQNIQTIVFNLSQACNKHYTQLMMKAYLAWFVENKVVSILRNSEAISFAHFSRPNHIKAFLKSVDINRKTVFCTGDVEQKLATYDSAAFVKRDKPKEGIVVKEEDIGEALDLSISVALAEYGIVLTGNYIMKSKGFSYKQAFMLIGNFMKDLNVSHARQKKILLNIVQKTYEMSPYNNKMKFLDWEELYPKTLGKVNGEVEELRSLSSKNQNDAYGFLI
jgi:hypothetical protein